MCRSVGGQRGLFDAMLGKSAGRAPSYAAEDDERAVQSPAWRVHELLQSPACSRACFRSAPGDEELEMAGLGWLMGGFP